MTTTRGIRLNNPGLLRHGSPWQGLAEDQPDSEFCAFTQPKWGIRAMAVTLINYQDKHRIRTVAGIIARWAPKAGSDSQGNGYSNSTDAYTQFVADKVRVSPNALIDVTGYETMRRLVLAIIEFENARNQPYTPAQIDKGLMMAGIEPPEKPVIQSRTVQGGTAAGVATLTGVIGTIQPAMPLMGTLAENAPVILGLIALAGLGYMLYARWDDKRRGLR